MGRDVQFDRAEKLDTALRQIISLGDQLEIYRGDPEWMTRGFSKAVGIARAAVGEGPILDNMLALPSNT